MKLFLILLVWVSPVFGQTIWYVTPSNSGTEDGLSKASGFTVFDSLDSKLTFGDSILVSKGDVEINGIDFSGVTARDGHNSLTFIAIEDSAILKNTSGGFSASSTISDKVKLRIRNFKIDVKAHFFVNGTNMTIDTEVESCWIKLNSKYLFTTSEGLHMANCYVTQNNGVNMLLNVDGPITLEQMYITGNNVKNIVSFVGGAVGGLTMTNVFVDGTAASNGAFVTGPAGTKKIDYFYFQNADTTGFGAATNVKSLDCNIQIGGVWPNLTYDMPYNSTCFGAGKYGFDIGALFDAGIRFGVQ